MNYLAHAYLSFGDPEIITGNIISDFVKGRKKYEYPSRILGGIDLHRAIDQFTDEHAVNKEVAKIFKPAYGLYSSAFIDVLYDHFLAKQLAAHGDEQLQKFASHVYASIDKHVAILPHSFNNIFPFMKQHNWLYNYQYGWGIERSIAGLVHRAKYISDSSTAYKLFEQKYSDLENAYKLFFPELVSFSLKKFSDIH